MFGQIYIYKLRVMNYNYNPSIVVDSLFELITKKYGA